MSNRISPVQSSNIEADSRSNSKRLPDSRVSFAKSSSNHVKRQRSQFSNIHRRKETSNTRAISACLTCKVLKERCDSTSASRFACQPCRDRKTSVFSRIPCFRYNISHLVFYRDCSTLPFYKGFPFTGSKAGTLPIVRWDDSSVQEVTLTHESIKNPLTLDLRRFSIPEAKYKQLEDSVKKLYEEQYGISDMDTTEKVIEQYIEDNKAAYLIKMLQQEDPLCKEVFNMAYQSAQNSPKILHDSLNLWCVARMLEGGWKFEGSEILDFVPNIDGIVEIIPAVTPLLSGQIGAVLIGRLLSKIRSSVLSKYEHLILKERRKHWLVLFLVTFVLLDNFERIVKFQRQIAIDRGVEAQFTNMSLINGILQSSNALLTVFHLACKGQKPFDLDWPLKQQFTRIQFCNDPSEQDVAFMRRIIPIIRRKHGDLISASNSAHYETNFWFTGQLFDSDWKPPDKRDLEPAMTAVS